ncbi:protein MLN51 homolog [Prosopis cineraria]|uniref:protein MLN51 homolog n=1 Tax=Prosopis cineraria TaxID=364024 RepID=UPI002410870A|nr:protein MLN51 homolog [Prosopis cineraria]
MRVILKSPRDHWQCGGGKRVMMRRVKEKSGMKGSIVWLGLVQKTLMTRVEQQSMMTKKNCMERRKKRCMKRKRKRLRKVIEFKKRICTTRGMGKEAYMAASIEASELISKESEAAFRTPLEAEMHPGNKDSEEKKENEPFAVPTGGAFYMHDDRFRDNSGGRHRHLRGGRRLWESKDDQKWGHDKFEEMTMQERHYNEGRRVSKRSYGARSKGRGLDHGVNAQGNRQGKSKPGNQSQVLKSSVRWRGPQRYVPTFKRNTGLLPQMQNKQPVKASQRSSYGNSGRTSTPTSNVESDPMLARKQVVASNLNSGSSPCYPSGSSNRDIMPKGDVQTGNRSRTACPGVTAEGFSVQQNNALPRGKNAVEYISMEKLYIDESTTPAVGMPSNNFHMPPSRSSGVNASQSSQPRASGRTVAIPVQMNYEPSSTHIQASKVLQTQLQATHRSSVPGQTQTSVLAPVPQLGQSLGSGFRASSPPKTSLATTSFDSGEIDAASDLGKFKESLVGKAKGGSRGSGRGSLLYGGAHVMGTSGNMGVSHGDQNFPATPAFLPVMRFGGQHPGGIGVPAVGMAFPGYVAQPQLGLGNSEMTWLPVLAGAAGALGASYGSPYHAVDSAYNARQSGQTPAVATSSKQINANNTNNEWKPPQQTADPVSDDLGQRQNKPRRYSEMNFGQ